LTCKLTAKLEQGYIKRDSQKLSWQEVLGGLLPKREDDAKLHLGLDPTVPGHAIMITGADDELGNKFDQVLHRNFRKRHSFSTKSPLMSPFVHSKTTDEVIFIVVEFYTS
jgi:hypothetical protein